LAAEITDAREGNPMLDHASVAHFRTFGFVVLRGLLAPDETGQLRRESEYALSNAYGDSYSSADIDVTRRPAFDVPTMTQVTPLAERLVADDPRMWQASHYLMGGATLPTNAEATCFLANARWHADQTPELAGVKFMTYLDPCSPSKGQLQVLPGSHRAATWGEYWDYLRQDPRRQGHLENSDEWPVPAVGLDTEPGDVIAFHVNLLHSSVGGERRLAWAVYYFEDPVLAKDQNLAGGSHIQKTRDAILHIGNYFDRGFALDKWPVWRDWARQESASDARRAAINRLSRIGVLDTDGADIGAPVWEPAMSDQSVVWSSGAPPRRRSAR
jgi:Phytanoyl-CoA dioxygenase (PhyH)